MMKFDFMLVAFNDVICIQNNIINIALILRNNKINTMQIRIK